MFFYDRCIDDKIVWDLHNKKPQRYFVEIILNIISKETKNIEEQTSDYDVKGLCI